MIEEFRKSINAIFYERVTSPFWGAVLASWSIWNWEIIYLSIFVPSEKLTNTKVDYIKEYLAENPFNTIWAPIITTIILLAVLPIVSNGAYWLSLIFNNWKVNKKRTLENKIPLSIEDSIKLRDEILKQEEKYLSLTREKDEKISNLIEQSKELSRKKTQLEKSALEYKISNQDLKSKLERIEDRKDFYKIFKGEWVYQIEDGKKETFSIINKNELEFSHEERYNLILIKKSGNNTFEILFYPPDHPKKDTGSLIRIVKIKRTDNIEEFTGVEYSINKAEHNTELENNKIRIYKL